MTIQIRSLFLSWMNWPVSHKLMKGIGKSMADIVSFKVDYESGPDEQGIIHTGMIGKQELFYKLERYLTNKNMLPDDYFWPDKYIYNEEEELPNYDTALCVPHYGNNGGIYLDIFLVYPGNRMPRFMRLASGKTSDESADAFFKMSRIAAECSLLLNGRGRHYNKSCTELIMPPDKALFLTTLLEHETAKCKDEQYKKNLLDLQDQLYCNRHERVVALGRREPEVYSLWIHYMPDIRREHCILEGSVQRGSIKDLLKLVCVCNDEYLYVLQRDEEEDYVLYACCIGKEYFSVHKQEGWWRFGTMEEIADEVEQEFRKRPSSC